MRVPLLDLKAQSSQVRPLIEREIAEVLDSCQFIMGPKVEAFEESVAEYSGAEFAIGVSSGTDALLISLMALDVGPGDIVVTTPYSFFATAGAVARLGGQPAFVDIEPTTFNLSPVALRHWFEADSSRAERTKAIIPVHLYGQCADMDPIMAVAADWGVPVIEDAAQAIGAKYESISGLKLAGAIGEIGCFSFFPSKNLGGIGDGGMVITSSSPLAERIRKLRNHGSHPKYYHQLIGGNFRLDAIQAAVLNAKLPKLDSWHEARQSNAAYYDERLTDLEQVRTPYVAQRRSYHIYNQYVVRVEARDELRRHLADANVGTEVYYPVPFHLQECFANLNYREGDLPEAESAAKTTLALPIYPELTIEMQDYVVTKIEEFYG